MTCYSSESSISLKCHQAIEIDFTYYFFGFTSFLFLIKATFLQLNTTGTFNYNNQNKQSNNSQNEVVLIHYNVINAHLLE